MAYKWKPNKTARREFAEKMQNDVEFKQNYEEKKLKKEEKKRATSKFDYKTAGGNYIPTKEQLEFCLNNENLFQTMEERTARNEVIYGYSVREKIHHDNIHIVNEIIRKTNNNLIS